MTQSSRFLALVFGAFAIGCGEKDPTSAGSGQAVRMLGLEGTDQVGVIGTVTPVPPTVLVIDGNNLPVAGVTVKFQVISGGGSIASQATTGANGEAKAPWTLGHSFTQAAVRATSGDLDTVVFVARALAPDAGISSFSRDDIAGDTLPAQTGFPIAHDLLSMRATFKRDSLILTLTFSRPVSAYSTFAADAVGGYIEFDIDDDAMTGFPAFADDFGASSNLGVDFALSLFDASPTAVILYSLEGETTVPVAFSGNVMTVRMPMRDLGSDDGNYGIVAIVGTVDRPTDIIPNTGRIAARLGSSSAASMEAGGGALLAPGRVGPRSNWGRHRLGVRR